MDLLNAQQKLTAFRDQLVREKTRQEETRKQLDALVAECATLEAYQAVVQAALDLLEQSNIVSRDYMKAEIEKLVTQGLRIIFEDAHIEFGINFTTKRNQTEAEFVISRGESEENMITGDILSTYGGGLVDIISISLRIIIMQLMKAQGPMLLDEPGKNISAQYIGNFGKFLTQISKTFDRQIIMITHNDRLAEFADNTFEVDQINEISRVVVRQNDSQRSTEGTV
jgi:DNA repair exonuclease SbcCD ATPase subunit